jgi:hypothetical protein
MDRRSGFRRLLLVAGIGVAGAMSIAAVQAQEMCGGATYPFPYTDVSVVGAPFCPGIMEAYVTGVSKGTTPTTFSPNNTVTRVQMTTFLQRSLDQGLMRASRRAALNQWWTPRNTFLMQQIIGGSPVYCAVDGENVWVSTFGQVLEVQLSTGLTLNTWTGANSGEAVLAVNGRVYVAGDTSPGSLYLARAPGPVVVVASNLGNQPIGIAFDGMNLWTANFGGSVSIITPKIGLYTVTTVTTGFNAPYGILYDGAHLWITDIGAGALLQTVTVGTSPRAPVFDGANIWVPNYNDNTITVVQASTGNVIATISADASNLLNGPTGASFDGERVLVTNFGGDSVTVFKAADLSFIANVSTTAGSQPNSACSDGIGFWVPLFGGSSLLQF